MSSAADGSQPATDQKPVNSTLRDRSNSFIRTIFSSVDEDAPITPVPVVGEGVCLIGPRVTPITLSADLSCPAHFYCPKINANDPLSFPSMCPPTLECQVLRLTSRFCPPQGIYEPQICPRGYYCPDFLSMLPCPEGYFCPIGRVEPIPCTMPFSHCPAESKKQFYYGGALLCVVIDLFLLVTYFVFRCRRLQREKRRTRHEVRRVSGRRHGTITEASYSKKMANFVTLSDHVDDRSDSDSSLPHLKSTIFSRRFWKKRVDRLINGIWTYMPLSWQQAHPGKAHSVEPQSHIINLHGDHLRGSTNSYTSVAQHTLALGLSVPKWTPSDSDSDTIVENLEMDDHPQSLESDSGNRHASLNLNKLVLGFRKAQNNQDLALRFRFQDLSLVLPSGKAILSGVTGSIDPGRVTVIMGPSGAGKSTFMNVLMGKATRTGGRLMINDREVEMYRFKKIIGYVPQDDIMLQELTVRENIAYSARVRLPHSWPRQEIEDFVDIVLEALDLSHVADNLIDSVSGGQRKRVNIGMELVTCPSAIFLDEPTSGLDATAAMKIANTMKKIAIDIGISVVAVIHQPRYEIFSEFDDLLMIAPGGLTAYLGQRKDIQPYFENLGFYFDVRHNPADILMDTLSGKGRRVDIKPLPGEDVDSEERKRFEMELEQKSKSHQYIGYDVAELVYAWKCREDAMSALNLEQELLQKADSSGLVDEPPPVPELPPEIYVTEFDQELLRQSVLEQGSNCGRSGFESCRTSTEKSDGFGQVDQVIAADFVVSEKETSKQEPSMTMRLPHTECELDFQHSTLQRACMERGANWFSQLAFAHNRSVTQQYRRCNAFALELLVALISGSIMGLAVMCYDGSLYQGLLVQPFSLISPAPVEVVIPLLALIIGCTIGLSGAPAGTKIFSEEKDVYWREASAGHNPFSYFMGKNVSATYRFFVSALHFTASFHILTCPNIAFWNLYVIHLSMFYTVYGISFIVAMIVKRENASMVAVCVIIVFAVLCGNGPNLKDARKWGFEWFLDMSFNRWAAEAWYSEELLIYDGVYEIWKVSTEHFGFTLNRFWTDIFWIVVIGCAARLLAFILLVLLNRQKQR